MIFSLMLLVFWRSVPVFCQVGGVVITPEEFGIKPGVDETIKLLQMFAAARAKQATIQFTGNKTYVFSPLTTVDITGIRGFAGAATFDLSATGAAVNNKSMTAVFELKGARSFIQNLNGKVTAGSKSIQLNKGLDINAGDILFLTSSENLPNLRRPYYAKGQRLTVATYHKSSGLLELSDTLFYSIQNGCLWKNNYQPQFSVSKQMRFITAPMNFISCFRLLYAHALISGYYKNFALTAVMFKSSGGEVVEMEADLPVTSNNGYSHCIQVGDLSFITIRNCRLTGGRHVISGIGGGLWKKEDCGGQGNVGYPSVMVVDGGVYRGSSHVQDIGADIGTVDSHGVVEWMIVRNCSIYGGVNLGANHVLIENVKIYCDGKRAFNIGSDVQPGSHWGNYTIRNVEIYPNNNLYALFISKSDVQAVKLEKVRVIGSANIPIMDFRSASPHCVEIKRMEAKGMIADHLLLLPSKSQLFLENPGFEPGRVKRIY